MSGINRLTVYSSGMADFVWVYPIHPGEMTEVSITVKEEFLGDVLDSLRYFGPAHLVEPPRFTSDAVQQKVLSLNPAHAERDLLTKLSGSEVRLEVIGDREPVTGRVIGVDNQDRILPSGVNTSDLVLILWSENKRLKFLADAIRSLEVLGEGPQSEIRKALDANAQGIRQGNTVVRLTVEAMADLKEASLIYIQYMVPMAAPKYTYRISQNKERSYLELFAVLDNTTGEDLDQFLVTVTTGQPISFTTDLATVRTPQRSRVNVVGDTALGAVLLEEGYDEESYDSSAAIEFLEAAGGSAKSRHGVMRTMGLASSNTSTTPAPVPVGDRMLTTQVQSSEVGDFQLYSCPEVISIAAGSSALIPLKTQEITAEIVLVYRAKDHRTRSFRAIQFQNQTNVNLARGVCSVFQDAVNAGKGILEDSRPGDTSLIPYQLETGVAISYEQFPGESKISRVGIANGTLIQESSYSVLSKYVINNKRDEPFQIQLEYPSALGLGSFLTVFKPTSESAKLEKIPSGWMIHLQLPAKTSITVQTRERRIDSQTVTLGTNNFNSYLSPLRQDLPGLEIESSIRDCFQVREKINGVQVQVQQAGAHKVRLIETARRNAEYYKGAPSGTPSNTIGDWIKTVNESEREIQAIDQQILPDLQEKLNMLHERLNTLIKKITVDWGATIPDGEAVRT